MSTETPQFENADVGELKEQEAEEQKEEQQKLYENNETLHAISKARSEKTIHVELEGEKLPFEAPKGEVDDIQDMAGEFAGVEEDDLSKEEYQRYQEMRDRVVSILAEKCKIDAATEAFWSSEFTPQERQQILGRLAEGGIEGDNAERFR